MYETMYGNVTPEAPRQEEPLYFVAEAKRRVVPQD